MFICLQRMSGIANRIRRHLSDPESHHRKIATGFVWVALFVFIGKLAGAAKEMAIAWRYGVSETVDAYVLVFDLINLPVSVWFSVLTVVLLPLAARIRHDDPVGLPRFRSELLGLTMLAGLGLGCLVWFGLPALLRAGWLGLSDQALAKALHMAGGLALLAPLGVLISLFSAWMLARRLHSNTLFEGIPALIILVALLLPGWAPEPLVWGTVAGFALHMVALATPLKRRGDLQAPSFKFSSPVWRGFRASMVIMAIGQALMSFTGIVDQFFAANLGPGALSTLSYANRILALILGMCAMAISRSALPVFSEMTAQRSAETNALALRWAWWMFGAGSMCALIGWIASPWMVNLLFERGAFTAADSRYVSAVLKYALVQIPFYTFSITLMSYIASQKRYWLLLLSGIVGLGMKIIAATILTSFMQLEGLAFSATFLYLATAIFFYSLINIKASWFVSAK